MVSQAERPYLDPVGATLVVALLPGEIRQSRGGI